MADMRAPLGRWGRERCAGATLAVNGKERGPSEGAASWPGGVPHFPLKDVVDARAERREARVDLHLERLEPLVGELAVSFDPLEHVDDALEHRIATVLLRHG